MKTKTLPKPTKFLLATALLSVFIGLFAITFVSGNTYAASASGCEGLNQGSPVKADGTPAYDTNTTRCKPASAVKNDQCGKGKDVAVTTAIDFGCIGNKCKFATCNPVVDMAFAIIKFLSAGVGVVIVGSLIYGGIMYSTSGDSPETNAKAKKRIRSNIVALMIFIFAYAILSYVVPLAVLK
ncbi:MAG: hypothetical protein WCK80_02050 [bacterium]